VNEMPETTRSTVCPAIAPVELSALREDGKVAVLDVRSAIEFDCERIEGAVNIPLPELEARLAEVPESKNLVIVCRSGKRAERAAFALLERGYRPKVLAGGLVAWEKAGMPVREGKKRLSIERQIQLVVGISVLTGVALGVFVSPWFLVIPAFFGAGLTFAGATGFCGLGVLLTIAPWNKLTSQAAGSGSACSSQDAKPRSGCCG
jgi:rhodanese-related sulfurtransferase